VAIFRWTHRKGRIAAIVAAILGAILLYLVITTAMETGKGLWGVLLILSAGIIAFLSTLAVTDGLPLGAESWTPWLKRRPISSIYAAMFASLAAMSALLALIAPRPTVESAPGLIEQRAKEIGEDVKEIRAAILPKAAAPPRIVRELPGTWGEPGCAVTYRFRIQERALIVDSVRRPSGAASHHLVATIVGAEGDAMNVTAEQPESARGTAITFTYTSNGVTERLTWEDQGLPVPLELDRCG